jgi:hypothetical protein
VFGWIFTGHQLGAGPIAFGAGLSRTALAILSLAGRKPPKVQPMPA